MVNQNSHKNYKKLVLGKKVYYKNILSNYGRHSKSNYCIIYWRKYKWRFKKNFIGVFPATYINMFTSFHDFSIESGVYYPFIITNTDRADKKGTHWRSFLDLHPKKDIFFFDSFGFTGFKEFIMNENKKNINRIFYDLKKFYVPDTELTLVIIKFSIKEYEKIKRSFNLSKTTVDVMHLIT